MALATLSIDLVAKLASLEEGMSKATRVAEKNAAAIEARYERIGSTIRNLAQGIAGAFGAQQFIAFVRNTVLGLDALNDLKDATGASIENLSALEDTALRTGTSFETVSGALVKFNKALGEAKPGSDVAKVFQEIGLSAAELRRIDPAEALRLTAVALGGFADDGTKARYVAELFGRSIAEVAPLLKDLATQGRLNGTVTAAQAEAAEAFANQLRSVTKNLSDASRGIVSEMLPSLGELAKALADTTKQGGLFALWNLELNAKFNATRLKNITESIAGLQEVIDKHGATEGRVAALEKLKREFDEVSRAAQAASDAIKRFTQPTEEEQRARQRGSGFGGVGADASVTSPPKKLKDIFGEDTRAKIDLVEQYADRLRQAIRATQDLSLAEQLRVDIVEGKLGKISNATRDQLIELANAADAARAKATREFVGPEIDADVLEQRKKLSGEINRILENTPTAKLEQQRALMRELTDLYEQGKFGLVGSEEAMRAFGEAAQTALGTLPEQWEATTKKMDEFSVQAARNIQDALGDTVLSTLQGRFDSIGRLWSDLIQRMISQALAARLGELLLGEFARTGKVGGLFGSFLGLFGLAKGGAFGAGGALQPFATGGVVSRPTLFRFAGGTGLMGEAGAEAILPLKRGRDGKLGVTSAGAATQNITINVDGGMNRSEVFAAISLAMNALRGEVKQTLRASGVA